MAELTFAEALALFKAEENNEVAALTLNDKGLQAILACWPMVQRRIPDALPARGGMCDVWSLLWSIVEFDEREVVELSGLPTGIAIAAFRRAKATRLIYPDGGVHKVARGVLQKLIRDALNGGKAR